MAAHDTVSALCDTLCRPYASTDPGLAAPYEDVVQFDREQQTRMSDYLRWPMRLLTFVFAAAAIGLTGRRFYRQSPEQQTRYVNRWRSSGFGVFRDFIRFHESLCLIALFHRLETHVRNQS